MPIYKQASKFLSLSIFFHHIHTEDAFSSFLGLLKISSTQKLRSFHGTATQLARSNLNASPSDCSIFVFMKMIFGDSYSGFLLLCFKSGTFVFVLDKQHFVHFFFYLLFYPRWINGNKYIWAFCFLYGWLQSEQLVNLSIMAKQAWLLIYNRNLGEDSITSKHLT